MGDRGLKILAVLVVLFAALFFFSDREDKITSATKQEPLLEAVPLDQVRSVQIQQGDKSVDLVLENGTWTLPAKSGYRADVGKVRALLLSVLEMTVSQEVTDNVEKHSLLGVSDDEVKAGKTKVSLNDVEKKPLAEVYLGKMRRAHSADGAPTPTGQYVRRGGEHEVFVIQQPVSVAVDLQNWIDSGIGSVMESQVVQIEQNHSSGGSSTSGFVLERKDGSSDFTVSSGKADENAINLVKSGLENMRMADVMKTDDAALKDLQFDSSTRYHLLNGLVYLVETAERKVGDTAPERFLRMSISFDPQRAEQLKQLKAAAPTPAAETKTETPTAETTPTATPAAKPAVLPEPATEEDAKALNDRYQPWIYKVPDYLAAKFRQGT